MIIAEDTHGDMTLHNAPNHKHGEQETKMLLILKWLKHSNILTELQVHWTGAQIQQGLWTTNELWANKDPRFFATIYTQNTAWKGAMVDYHNGLRLPDGTIQNDGSYQGVLALGTTICRQWLRNRFWCNEIFG